MLDPEMRIVRVNQRFELLTGKSRKSVQGLTVRESLADITQARQMLDYEPQVSFEEGLRRSIDYYRSVANK